MARTRFKTKVKNGNTYYSYRLRHTNLRKPWDIYARRIDELEEKIKSLTRDLDNGVLTDNVRFGDYMKAWIDNVHVINKNRETVSGYYSRYDNYIVGSVRKLISPCIRYAYTQKKIIADFSRSITLQKPSDVDDDTNQMWLR